jgi:L-malate glycosyltransferase
MNYVLFGDGQSPHLLKWARALAQQPGLNLFAASSRGFAPGFDELMSPQRRLALNTQPQAGGGNVAVLRTLPRLAAWLRRVQPHWVHAHYLTSHGLLAALSQSLLGVPGRLVGSAWGSDILLAPPRGRAWRSATRWVLGRCALATSDSQHMAGRMRELGSREVMVFPFGLEALPEASSDKDPFLFFSNRGLEPLYQPERVLAVFADVAWHWPQARLVVANEGSLRAALQAQAARLRLAQRVVFTGRLDAATQALLYDQATWYLSLPASDSVAVSVLEAMAHGCLPLLSALPANAELVRHGNNGLLLPPGGRPAIAEMQALAARAGEVALANRAWVAENALFGPSVERFLARLRAL